MNQGRKPEPHRPSDQALRDLERRLEASFGALVDDLSIGRGLRDLRPAGPKDPRSMPKVSHGPR